MRSISATNCAGVQGRRGADETVAALDVVFEKRERLARLQGFHPQGDLAQFDRHRIDVHAEDASANDVALGMLDGEGARLVVAGLRHNCHRGRGPVGTVGRVALHLPDRQLR